MKTIIRLTDLFKECLRTKNKRRGLACVICMFICVAIFLYGTFFTINNFISKPVNAEIKIKRSK